MNCGTRNLDQNQNQNNSNYKPNNCCQHYCCTCWKLTELCDFDLGSNCTVYGCTFYQMPRASAHNTSKPDDTITTSAGSNLLGRVQSPTETRCKNTGKYKKRNYYVRCFSLYLLLWRHLLLSSDLLFRVDDGSARRISSFSAIHKLHDFAPGWYGAERVTILHLMLGFRPASFASTTRWHEIYVDI